MSEQAVPESDWEIEPEALEPDESIENDNNDGESNQSIIVALGASAGGIEAFESLFSQMPPDHGISFLVLQHSTTGKPSTLTKLLQAYTSMEVVTAADNLQIEPNKVYVIPPGKHAALLHGVLQLLQAPSEATRRFTVDSLFRAL